MFKIKSIGYVKKHINSKQENLQTEVLTHLGSDHIVIKPLNQYYTIVYKTSLKDAFAYYYYSWTHNRVLFGLLLFNSIIFILPFLLSREILYALFSIFLTFIFYYILCILIAMPINLLVLLLRKKKVLTEHIIMFFDDYFVEQTAYDRNEHQWKDIKSIVQSKEYIFLYISNSNAHIIPKNIFNDEASISEFVSFAENKIKLAKVK
jgi:hypothetical protein